MIKYIETTSLILGWSFLLSIAWSIACFWLTSSETAAARPTWGGGMAIMPSLVLGPLFLVAAYRFFAVSLIFPLHVFASRSDLIRAAFFPALTLILASGLIGNLRGNVRAEYFYWRTQRFVLVGEAMGRSVSSSLRWLVLTKSLINSWSETLPWLFGELIIIEAVFNAPGLGLDAWQAAKIRDFAMLSEAVSWLAALYLICVVLTTSVSSWLGRQLESYG